MTQTQPRTLTGARVAALLSKAGIPALGANKLPMLSRTGNTYVREDGTAIRIFNVLAFRNTKEQADAVASWKSGLALENAGDINGAQEHYKAAYNHLMSFSVLESNAPDYEGIFEVAGIVENVPASAALQAAGTKTVIGFNRPRPVAVSANISNTGETLFVVATPSTKKVSKKKTTV